MSKVGPSCCWWSLSLFYEPWGSVWEMAMCSEVLMPRCFLPLSFILIPGKFPYFPILPLKYFVSIMF